MRYFTFLEEYVILPSFFLDVSGKGVSGKLWISTDRAKQLKMTFLVRVVITWVSWDTYEFSHWVLELFSAGKVAWVGCGGQKYLCHVTIVLTLTGHSGTIGTQNSCVILLCLRQARDSNPACVFHILQGVYGVCSCWVQNAGYEWNFWSSKAIHTVT